MMHPAMGSDEWKTINWKQIQKNVYRLQTRIFKAQRRGDTKQVHRLQKLMVKSRSAKLLAVRRVTQDNQGKATAGVDGIKSLTPLQRLDLATALALTATSKPTRRVMIPKPGSREKRPLGIPCLDERAKQMLVKFALEPEWEAQFEPGTYGFRSGRSAHDAIEAIFKSVRCKSKYVLDADIRQCFDKINQEKLLQKLNTFPTLHRQIQAWLRSGVVLDGQLFPTPEGTPQGGVLSPLLALIALQGLEIAVRNCVNPGGDAQKELTVVFYADDFVILHPSLTVIQRCQDVVQNWLSMWSLELNLDKTRIVHTLIPSEGKAGFDFLGFHIRQYAVGKHQSVRNTHGQCVGFKTLIKPSPGKIAAHIEQIRQTIRAYKTSPQEALIIKLNPIIRGWSNYYSTVVSKQAFERCDNILFSQLRAWSRYRTGNFSFKTLTKYWHYIEDTLTFSTKDGIKLAFHRQVPIVRHTKVRRDKSYFDGDVIYWSTRKGTHPELPQRVARLLQREQGRCAECGLMFTGDDLIEVDHRLPKSQGGTDQFDNLQPLHRHCHDVKTARDLSLRRKAQHNTAQRSIATKSEV